MSSKNKIVIFDELPIISLCLKEKIEKIGFDYEILLANSLDYCNTILNNNIITFLIFDLGEANKNLKQIIQIRNNNPSIYIMVFSLDDSYYILKQCLLKKMNAFLSKYADETEINIALKSFLNEKRYLNQKNKNRLLNE